MHGLNASKLHKWTDLLKDKSSNHFLKVHHRRGKYISHTQFECTFHSFFYPNHLFHFVQAHEEFYSKLERFWAREFWLQKCVWSCWNQLAKVVCCLMQQWDHHQYPFQDEKFLLVTFWTLVTGWLNFAWFRGKLAAKVFT